MYFVNHHYVFDGWKTREKKKYEYTMYFLFEFKKIGRKNFILKIKK